MKRIGFIDLDTSHPRSFAKRLHAMPGVRVTAVFDRARVRGREETESFCRDFDAAKCESPAQLAQQCDGIMILSADWETHGEDLKLCLEAGIPCYSDKPLLGSLAQIRAFVDAAAATGTPVFGGSGWRWNEPVQTACRQYARRAVDHVLAVAPNHGFYYGIHAVECVLGLLGPGITWVKTERAEEKGRLVALGHRRGAVARVMLESPFFWRKVAFTVDREPVEATYTGDDIHDGICNTFVRMLESGQSPIEPSDLVESVKVMFAVEESATTGRTVSPDALEAVTGHESAAFMAEYRAAYAGKKKG
ncbi:MAG: Gfo/Idh/MocA family oxidoreductase [Kiritimatiellae bacterium]|nr:Gfo/Idh/MocA family oxidoreductase [Kiritimatiellia bacterium]